MVEVCIPTPQPAQAPGLELSPPLKENNYGLDGHTVFFEHALATRSSREEVATSSPKRWSRCGGTPENQTLLQRMLLALSCRHILNHNAYLFDRHTISFDEGPWARTLGGEPATRAQRDGLMTAEHSIPTPPASALGPEPTSLSGYLR